MTQNKWSGVSYSFYQQPNLFSIMVRKLNLRDPDTFHTIQLTFSRVSIMTQNTKFQVEYPFCHICDFQILCYQQQNLPHLLLPKYYMGLQYKTDSGGIALVETELEAQNPTHWLCLHAILLAIPMTLKIPTTSFKTTTIKV